MHLNYPAYRRMLFIYGAIVVAVALALAVGVLGAVKEEAALGATSERAVTAFWVNIAMSLLAAGTLFVVASRSKKRAWISTSAHVVVGLIVMFLGLALADAASAYQSHGLSMKTATTVLYVCAAADLLTGALIVTTGFLRSKKE